MSSSLQFFTFYFQLRGPLLKLAQFIFLSKFIGPKRFDHRTKFVDSLLIGLMHFPKSFDLTQFVCQDRFQFKDTDLCGRVAHLCNPLTSFTRAFK